MRRGLRAGLLPDLFVGLVKHQVPDVSFDARSDVALLGWSAEVENEGLGALLAILNLNAKLDEHLQGLGLGQGRELRMEIELQGVIGHPDNHFLHQLDLRRQFDGHTNLLRLRALPVFVVHRDDVEVLELQ